MRFVRQRAPATIVAIAASLLLASLAASPVAAAGSAEKGKAAFIDHGCWQCHGFQGQGGVTGAKLAPNPIPPEAFSAFVRFTNTGMPPYQKAILSDDDLADIYAYLKALPKTADYKSIPLLNP